HFLCLHTFTLLPLTILFFLYIVTSSTPTSSLSLHDALPIWSRLSSLSMAVRPVQGQPEERPRRRGTHPDPPVAEPRVQGRPGPRSEEHTSELQSHLNLVCRLLLEKKKTKKITYTMMSQHRP